MLPPGNRSGVREAYIPHDVRIRACAKETATRFISTWPNSGSDRATCSQTSRIRLVKSNPLFAVMGGSIAPVRRTRLFRGCGRGRGFVPEARLLGTSNDAIMHAHELDQSAGAGVPQPRLGQPQDASVATFAIREPRSDHLEAQFGGLLVAQELDHL